MTVESKSIYITGGTGFIGKNLILKLLSGDSSRYKIVKIFVQSRSSAAVSSLRQFLSSENPNLPQDFLTSNIIFVKSAKELKCDIDVLVNLAGEPIAAKRWTEQQKRIVRDSRITLTRQLISDLENTKRRVGLVLQCSAIGIYGYQARDDEPCEEQSGVGAGFAASLCKDWESVSESFSSICIEKVIVRLGLVIGKGSDIEKKLYPLFKMGLGGPISNGKQAFPWIHIQDVVNGLLFLISDYFSKEIDSSIKECLSDDNACHTRVINFVSPQIISQKKFSQAYAKFLSRPAFVVTPRFALKLFLGRMAEELLLGGCSVSSKYLISTGFKFIYADIDSVYNLRTSD